MKPAFQIGQITLVSSPGFEPTTRMALGKVESKFAAALAPSGSPPNLEP